ncbi:GNAT family N-acetyltransferase [Deinococcus planocerae]|uniref:GNAT family N-acetyltransferase n=1 Tax=Deinococcus planocerae TaxID=1737569 RepID=UPI000C7F2D61|nr:GNAT family N-acetyltransferase [Deinococcus planocerae]
MSFYIRAFKAGDLAAVRALHEQSQTEPTVDRAATQEEDASSEEVLRRFVAEEGGDLVGYGYVARSAWHPEGWFQCEVFVLPSARRRGMGSELTNRAVAWAEAVGATSLTTWVNGLFPEFEHFASQRGFEEVQRFVTMTLSVAEADDERLAQWVARAQQNGLSLFTFEEKGRDQEARQKLYELNRRLAPLLPGNGDEFPTFEEYEREIIEAEWFRPEGQLIAAQGEHWVGLVGLGFYEEGRRLHHEFTALDPTYQGRGIALALKAWSVQKAKAWGMHEIRTGNDASNTAIISLNRRLGYHLQPGVVKLRRTLRTG